jgi:acyl transferase domain-containing protein
MTGAHDSEALDGIAIIGMSGRFPGAHNLSEFWNNLKNSVESISFFSKAEKSTSNSPALGQEHRDFVNAAGVLDGIEWFDAPFFGFSAMEAATLDPQQRLLLECAWHAMEEAGYDPENCQGPVGVYAGCAMSTYLFNLLSNPEHREIAGDFQVFTGNDKDFLTTRISYKLNLKGPSIAVQTACSTSLVAVAMACDSLLAHQCDLALAGGVAIRVPQNAGYVYQEGQIFSRDGHTRSFDADASGTLFSNGVGLVVLKRLEDAIADRDNIRAVIKGTAINNDGSMKVGYAAPSPDAQAEVVAMAHALAGIDPRTIGYVEAHGTATPMGDSIEVAALTKAFRAKTEDKNFCPLGSVKSNVGHLDAASGIAALIKTVLALEHEAIPASINFTRPNPKIDFASSPFLVNTQLRPWPRGHAPRRAGVHSFGIGGTNAHIVLEESPACENSPSPRSRQLLLLSARSKPALQALNENFACHLREHTELQLADVAYTCQTGRRAFAQRQFLVCENIADAAEVLSAADEARILRATKPPSERSLTFLFPGQCAEFSNVGFELYRSEPTFRKHIDNCSAIFKTHLAFDLRSYLYPPAQETGQSDPAGVKPEPPELALFAVEFALAQLWMEWGVHPNAMIGEGVGEYAAACLAGVFSLEDAAVLLDGRGRTPHQSSKVSLHPPKIPFVSSATGTWITAANATSLPYWENVPQNREHFAQGLAGLLAASNRTFLEIGPGRRLTKLIEQHPAWTNTHIAHPSLPGIDEKMIDRKKIDEKRIDEETSETESMLNTLGRLWLEGTQINWSGFWLHEKRRRVPLPTYAFDRKRYWVEPQGSFLSRESLFVHNAEQQSVTPAGAPRCGVGASPDRGTFCAPGDDVETGIAQIWQRVLGVDRVGIYDNFFALGGHSMMGAQLLALMRSAFHVEIPLSSLFEVPTVAGMAERIRAFR